jgi:hypothetical protein
MTALIERVGHFLKTLLSSYLINNKCRNAHAAPFHLQSLQAWTRLLTAILAISAKNPTSQSDTNFDGNLAVTSKLICTLLLLLLLELGNVSAKSEHSG